MIPDTLLHSIASDNNAGVHPIILQAIADANAADAIAYGDDPWTQALEARLAGQFGPSCHAFPVFLGTAANVLCLQAMTRPWQGVICAPTAHINRDECGAVEAVAGLKLLHTARHAHGKISPQDIAPLLGSKGFVHHVQPRVVSITQPTEHGVCYTLEELRAIGDFCKEHELLLHMDGARLSNACAALGCSLRACTADVGVDALSLGGTKNGMMFGEAVVVFRAELAEAVPFLRKQGMQLVSKMRYLSAQLLALYESGLWLANARHANAMAAALARRVQGMPGLEFVHPVETNALFVRAPRAVLEGLRQEFFFYFWDDGQGDRPVGRWMTSWSTSETTVERVVACLESLC
ncbi:threonine aldolase family protein [Megalodesulfovibrio paquesii]